MFLEEVILSLKIEIKIKISEHTTLTIRPLVIKPI